MNDLIVYYYVGGYAMKKNNVYKLLICFILSTILLSINHFSFASWVFLAVDDLIDKSDSVLIGEVVKQIGETKGELPALMWQVKVDYYLKGEMRDQIITVITPSRNLSVHYDLDQWGKRVLLFISKSGDYYAPLSPQGVMPVTLAGKISKSSNTVLGKDLVNNIKITYPNSDGEYKAKLEKFIASRDIFRPNKIIQPQKTHNRLIYLIVITVIGISAALIIIYMLFKSKRKLN
jgi:hypothetical protein